MDSTLTRRQRHASLATEIFGCPNCPIGKSDMNHLADTVDHGLTENCPDLIRRGKKSDILSSEIWRETLMNTAEHITLA